ncbi:MAG TPA: hypothetical protein VFY22_01805, partial [Hydrogenophaga sp.]|nr:hypothetical protein [Hydrogenophaga sp.]
MDVSPAWKQKIAPVGAGYRLDRNTSSTCRDDRQVQVTRYQHLHQAFEACRSMEIFNHGRHAHHAHHIGGSG